MPARNEKGVCPSVCPSARLSNAWIVTKRKKICPDFFIPYERTFKLVFLEEEWLVGSDLFYLKLWVNRPARWSEIVDFEPILASSASAFTPSEKSLINAKKSTTRFPMSLR